MATNHILYRGKVRDTDTAKPGEVVDVLATREHSGCLVLATIMGHGPRCVGFFTDSNQAIEEAVSLAAEHRSVMAVRAAVAA